MRSIKNEYIGLFVRAYTRVLHRTPMIYFINGYPEFAVFDYLGNNLRVPIRNQMIPIPEELSGVRRLI